MNDNYLLMHKDVTCGVIAVDRDSGALTEFKVTEKEFVPFLGNADDRLMKIWWNHRAVPGSRRDMEELIKKAGCDNAMGYLAKNLALSLTDTYWICPADINLVWTDINLYKMCGSGKEVVEYRSGTSYDPNASLGGQMNKYWDISKETPVLVKKAYENFGQQSMNEVFATEVHSRQNTDVPFASYKLIESEDNAVCSSCDSFTTENVEFISAYEVIRSSKKKASESDFDHYLNVCEAHGLNKSEMQEFMDYLILSDFAISNVDEHLQNFGVLRDADTLKLIGPAPIFDSGNSMFFNYNSENALTRTELLEMEISSLHKNEEKMLSHVSDRRALNYGKLPKRDEVREMYSSFGLPDERASFIAESYENKLSLLRDLQKGIKISLYNEKHK